MPKMDGVAVLRQIRDEDPGAKIVNGFKPVMPTFQGLVSEEQLNALVAYIKSLSQPAGTAGAVKTAAAAPAGARQMKQVQ